MILVPNLWAFESAGLRDHTAQDFTGSHCVTWLAWNSLCRPAQPQTQNSVCLCLSSVGIKGMSHHSQLKTFFVAPQEQRIDSPSARPFLRGSACCTYLNYGLLIGSSEKQNPRINTKSRTTSFLQSVFIQHLLHFRVYVLFLLMCLSACLNVCMCTMNMPGTLRGQKRSLDTLKETRVTEGCELPATRALRIGCRSTARATSDLKSLNHFSSLYFRLLKRQEDL